MIGPTVRLVHRTGGYGSVQTVDISPYHQAVPTRFLVLAMALLLAAPAAAREVAGVQVAEFATVDDTRVPLQGTALRTKFVFKIYVLGLYTPTKHTTAASFFAADDTEWRACT